MSTPDVNGQFLISICIILLGYLAKRTRYLTEKEGESIAQLIFNITLPALVINVFPRYRYNRNWRYYRY